MFLQGIPGTAGGTFALPLWGFIAAGCTEKYGFCLGHDRTSSLFSTHIIAIICLIVK
jgi:hypothetical protein